MKKIICLILVMSIGIIFAQDENTVESKVVDVTVFKNRALVTREAKKNLGKGEHILVFSNISRDLQDESARVTASGPGTVKIMDVKVEHKFITENQSEKLEALEAGIDKLKQNLQISHDQIAVYNSKKEFVESLQAEALKVVNAKILTTTPSINKWNEMLKFVDSNLNDIYKGLREEEIKKQLIEKKLKEIQKEINQSKTRETEDFKEIIVKIENDKTGIVNIQPTYMVQNASWYPIYDARLASQSKTIEINYYGMIQQSTGEEWENISLTLSTAEPLTTKFLPELTPWYINSRPLPKKSGDQGIVGSAGKNYKLSYTQNWGIPAGKGTIKGYVIDQLTAEPLVGVNVTIKGTNRGASTDTNGRFLIPNVDANYCHLVVDYIGYSSISVYMRVVEKHEANLVIELNESTIELDEVIAVVAERPVVSKDMTNTSMQIRGGRSDEVELKPKYTDVYQKELSTNFRVKSKSSIPSDNNSHKVIVSINDLPIEFKYTSIPKISPIVYLHGKIINNTEFPLLEGEVNVFVDHDFINKTFMNTIVPSDTLQLALGSDERIQIEKKLIKKYQESTGLLSGSRKITYDYEIQITNNRKSEEMILVQDQLPISMDEDIQVDILIPKKEKEELNNDFKLEWNVKLKPGEKRIIPLKFSIEYPKNLRIYGLE